MIKISQTSITFTLFLLLLVIIIFLFFNGIAKGQTQTAQNEILGKTDTVEGIQYLDLTAKGGYFPSVINAKADIETILRVKTASTFDCSSALTIPKLKIRKNLPPTASTEVLIGAQPAGTKLLGTCSMGMYSFNLVFN